MWKIDNYGNAKNDATGSEIYIIICSDGLSRVYCDDKVINTFTSNADAIKFVAKKVIELNGEDEK